MESCVCRPTGSLFAWIIGGGDFARKSRAARKACKRLLSLEERWAVRHWGKILPHAQPLFDVERAKRYGGESEPDEVVCRQ
eukprot:11183718-Lingulodinium_polyedra.AAC.1